MSSDAAPAPLHPSSSAASLLDSTAAVLQPQPLPSSSSSMDSTPAAGPPSVSSTSSAASLLNSGPSAAVLQPQPYPLSSSSMSSSPAPAPLHPSSSAASLLNSNAAPMAPPARLAENSDSDADSASDHDGPSIDPVSRVSAAPQPRLLDTDRAPAATTVTASPESSNSGHGCAPTLDASTALEAPTRDQVPEVNSIDKEDMADLEAQVTEADCMSLTAFNAAAVTVLDDCPENFGSRGEWKAVDQLGSGSFGSVSTLVHKRTGLAVALKVMSLDSLESSTKLSANEHVRRGLREILTMQRLLNPFIVRVLFARVITRGASYGLRIRTEDQVIRDTRCIYHVEIVMELMNDGSLDDRLVGQPINAPLLYRYATQMMLGLHALHLNDIAHNDLKPANIFVRGDKIKIGDFGGAVRFGEEREEVTRAFAGPELFDAATASRCAPMYDMFAVGMTLLCMATGQKAFFAQNNDGEPISIGRAAQLYKCEPVDVLLKCWPCTRSVLSPESQSVLSWLIRNLLSFEPRARLPARACALLLGSTTEGQFTLSGSFERAVEEWEQLREDESVGDVKLAEVQSVLHNDSDDWKAYRPEKVPRARYFGLPALAVCVTLVMAIIIQGMVDEADSGVNAGTVFGLQLLSCFLAVLASCVCVMSVRALAYRPIIVFGIVYVLVVVFAWVLRARFHENGETALRNCAMIYALAKMVTFMPEMIFMRVDARVVKSFAQALTPALFSKFRHLGVLVAITLGFQFFVLYLCSFFFTRPATLGELIALYPIVWLLSTPRHMLHFVSVRVFHDYYTNAQAKHPIKWAVREALEFELASLLAASALVTTSSVFAFLVTLSTAILNVAWWMIQCSGERAGNDRYRARGGTCCGVLFAVAATLASVAKFTQRACKGALTYTTKYNVTTMAMQNESIWEAIRITKRNKNDSRADFGSGSLVTNSPTSAYITNLCLFNAAIVYLIVAESEPLVAFFAMFVTYVLSRTLLEPMEAFVMFGINAWDNEPGLLRDVGDDLVNEFAALNDAVEAQRREHEGLFNSQAAASSPAASQSAASAATPSATRSNASMSMSAHAGQV